MVRRLLGSVTVLIVLGAGLAGAANADADALSPRVSGVVTSQGSPLAGVRVNQLPKFAYYPSMDSSGTSDGVGAFSFPAVGGSFRLQVSGPGPAAEGVATIGALSLYTDRDVVVSGDLDLGTLDFPRLKVVTVRVVDAAGDPVPGAELNPAGKTLYLGWRRGSHPLSPSLPIGIATYFMKATADGAGQVQLRMPVLPRQALPSAPVVYTDPSGGVYTTSLSEATRTGATYTVAMDTLDLP